MRTAIPPGRAHPRRLVLPLLRVLLALAACSVRTPAPRLSRDLAERALADPDVRCCDDRRSRLATGCDS